MSFEQNDPRHFEEGFVHDLNSAIRDNPLAAGLIGVGMLWMFFGAAKLSAVGGAVPGAARSLKGAVGAVAEAGGSAGAQLADAARQVGDRIASGVQGASGFVHDTFASGYETVTSDAVVGPVSRSADAVAGAVQTSARSGAALGTSVTKNLSETLARQPLLLGAIGLAIGAGIASAFPSTRIESDLMGEAGAATREKIQDFASDTTDFVATRAKRALHDVKQEAEAQGLTPSAARDALMDVAERAKAVAGAARESVKERLS